jgi:hypothetical protein
LEVRSPTPLGPHDENGGTEDEEPFDPASDPVMPEHTAKAFAGPRVFAVGGPEAASETNEPETPLRQSILRTLEGDDRDIIIVGGEDSQCDTAAVGAAEDESTGRRRQEYRQLFAKLRRG